MPDAPWQRFCGDFQLDCDNLWLIGDVPSALQLQPHILHTLQGPVDPPSDRDDV